MWAHLALRVGRNLMRGVSLDRILRHVGSKVRCWTIRDFPFAPSVLSFQLPLLKALVKMEERSSNFIREKEKQQVRESVQSPLSLVSHHRSSGNFRCFPAPHHNLSANVLSKALSFSDFPRLEEFDEHFALKLPPPPPPPSRHAILPIHGMLAL
eukprot:755682-Hanusia_phi.AAC.1